MELLAKQLYLKANELLLQAKDRRNWGAIGEFSFNSTDIPDLPDDAQFAALRQKVEQMFVKNGEPGIFIQILECEGRFRVAVGRNENE